MGSGAILRRKRPAAKNIAIEKDLAIIDKFGGAAGEIVPALTIINGDAISYLSEYKFTGRELVYCDPPYMISSRRGGKIYGCAMDDNDHVALLKLLIDLPCMVAISGYRSTLYDKMLASWRLHTFTAQTRRGTATEYLWMNYPTPKALHDYSFVGDNYRERERIKKKVRRWSRKLAALPTLERQAILSDILSS